MGRRPFTLIELLIVTGILLFLAGFLMPKVIGARSLAIERTCADNLRKVQFALSLYAEGNQNFYPLELTEDNPHPELMKALDVEKNNLRDAFYCPQARAMEEFAQSIGRYAPASGNESIVNTDDNWKDGNISYIYWSFKDNKGRTKGVYSASTQWREVNTTYPYGFFPRGLKSDRRYSSPGYPYASLGVPNLPFPAAGPCCVWVLTDFFRKGAPSPHMQKNELGANTVFLDGHVDLIIGQARGIYK
ncbi:MAG: type II secretion system protein [Victivallales bacterium]